MTIREERCGYKPLNIKFFYLGTVIASGVQRSAAIFYINNYKEC